MEPLDPIVPRPLLPPPIARAAPVRRVDRERERGEQRERARRQAAGGAEPDRDADEGDDGRAHIDVTA